MPPVHGPTHEATVQYGPALQGEGKVTTMVEGMLEKMLRRDEGERLKVYADSLGHPTIGIGRALDTQGISEAEASFLLGNDISRVQQEAQAFPFYAFLRIERQAVVLSMLFQLGFSKFLLFKNFLSAMARGDWKAAAGEMRNSEAYRQTPARWERLAKQMESGEFQE